MEWKKTEEKDCIKSFLASNGLKNNSDIERFLNFSKKDLRKTYKDLDAVVEQLIDSLNKKEKIVIYGDYDADGINATVISLRALRRLGADVDFFINDRFIEGYGLNVKGMEKVLSKFPDVKLIFTCDNGIAAQEGIDHISETFPNDKTTVWCGAIDPCLNAQKYIVPGLGDAGDLCFGEKL